MIQYEDFTVTLAQPVGDGLTVHVRSSAGEDRGHLSLSDLGNLLGDDATLVPRTSDGLDVGGQLYRALLGGGLESLFAASWAMVESKAKRGLRIKLVFDLEEPLANQLSSLPWELLYRRRQGSFLGLSVRTPIVRYLSLPQPARPVTLETSLRILVVLASPKGAPPLMLDVERRNLEQALDGCEDAQVTFLDEATPDKLQAALEATSFHVVHFMGHGDHRPGEGGGDLILQDHYGGMKRLSAEALATLVRDQDTLNLVFLNACKTARPAAIAGHAPFSGVATALVREGLPAVVAMRWAVTDRVAVAFSRSFYSQLISGVPVDAATAAGRKAVYVQDSSSFEWAVPEVVMQSPDGYVFIRIPDRGLVLREIARVFDNDRAADDLLRAARLPPEVKPVGQPTVLAFWEAVFTQFDNGAVVDGSGALLKAAAKKFPGNPVFRRAVERTAQGGWR